MQRRSYDLSDGQISALHFGNVSQPVQIVLCHANGFNARSYRVLLESLGVHAVALDLRGHGQSQLPTDPHSLASWDIFADDIAQFFERYVERPVVLAGHSYGAVSGILSLPRTRHKVRGYVGFDPVLVPWLFRVAARTAPGRSYMKKRIPIARKAGTRTREFASVEAAFERYSGRGAFKGMPDAVLRDYLIGGLKPDGDRMVLACAPEWEQAIFVAQSHNLWPCIPLLPDNSRIVFAGARGKVSTAGQRKAMARKQPAISVEFEAERAHLFALSDPDFAADVLRSVLNG